jgi:ribonuclease HI
MAKKKQKYYVVWEGNQTGIFTSWKECQKHIKGYGGAKYKSFESKQVAEDAFAGSYFDAITPSKKKVNRANPADGTPVWTSIAVDAACSGNPGLMEYQGVETNTGKVLFKIGPLHDGTNNVGEFLALVHGLAFLQQKGSLLPIYSDSKIAMGWIQKKKCNTKLEKTKRNATLFDLIKRGEKWLKNNTFDNEILKWKTKSWGEIPADFGRK